MRLFKIMNPLTKFQEKRNCLFFKGITAHRTRGLTLRTFIVVSGERLKSLFHHVKHIRAHCIRTKHVPNKFNIALVIPSMRGECLAHHYCTQLIHTCLRPNNGSCRDGEFRVS